MGGGKEGEEGELGEGGRGIVDEAGEGGKIVDFRAGNRDWNGGESGNAHTQVPTQLSLPLLFSPFLSISPHRISPANVHITIPSWQFSIVPSLPVPRPCSPAALLCFPKQCCLPRSFYPATLLNIEREEEVIRPEETGTGL